MPSKSAETEPTLTSFEEQTKAVWTAWMNMQRPMFSMMTEINGRLIGQALRLNDAWIGFFGRQIEHEIVASQRLMKCRTVNEFMSTYQDILRKAQADVQSELTEISRLNQSLAGETVDAVRAGLNEAAQELRH
jgi:hypothetical protein